MMRAVAAGMALVAAFASTALGQLTKCQLTAPGGVGAEIIGNMEIARGGGGITVTCPSRNIRLQADSGEMWGEERVELFGRVHYEEPTRINLRSDFLTYSLRDERIHVRGSVVATLPNGSTLTGPEATYLRAVPRVRSIEELLAVQNPTVTIKARDSTEKPVVVNARTIFMRGDSLIYASRSVVINRTDLVARADSAFLDGRVGTESMRLMLTPSVEGLEGRKFRLEGQVIDAYSKERKLERVIARGKGHATSQDLDIVADTIDLRMSNDAMERAIAWSRGTQARATAPGQTITADSIDVRMPGQKVRVVHAIRNARADADADTIRFRTTERDWLRGDTVVAWFDSTATRDTSKTPPIERIVASHRSDSAQAYYHMPAADTAIKTPAISYVRGREILIEFRDRKVGLVSVRDSVVGMYLEPKRDTTAKAGARAPARPPGPPTHQDTRPPAGPPTTPWARP
ncbi:MAG TPA: hypothetical protein VFO55_04870 [Gemmatimonadaceae bacterium]|nr:hypothetical protein [Gemmatimonadaceae bacterium]